MVSKQLQKILRDKPGKLPILIMLAAVFLVILFWGAVRFTHATGTGTDFIHRWVPVRMMLKEGLVNPYSEEAVLQTQLFRYGRPAAPGQTPGLFAYPYYTAFLYLPFAAIPDFVIARAFWLTLSVIGHALLVILTMRILSFQPRKELLLTLIIFALFSADMAQSLIDGNPASFTALFAWLAVFLVHRGKDRAAGICLALSTMKPQMVILFFLLVWLWAISNRRWLVITYSVLTMSILIGGSFILFPGWLEAFIGQIISYRGIASPSTPAAILPYWLPERTTQAAAASINVISLGVIAWGWSRCWKKGVHLLLWAASLTFVLMPLTGITSAKSNYTAMLPALVLVIHTAWETIERRNIITASLLAALPVSWVIFLIGREQVYFVDFYPLPVILTVLLLIFRQRLKNSVLPSGSGARENTRPGSNR